MDTQGRRGSLSAGKVEVLGSSRGLLVLSSLGSLQSPLTLQSFLTNSALGLRKLP